MEDFISKVSNIMQELNLMDQNYSNDIQDVLNKVDAIVNKCKEKENDKTPKPEKKKPKRAADAAFVKIEDGNVNTMQITVNQSHRMPKAVKKKLLQPKQASSKINLKVPGIEADNLSDNDRSLKKINNTKIKKEKFKISPQIRRVTRASSRNQNLSKTSHNGSNESLAINESVELIHEEVSVITISEEDEDTNGKIMKQKSVIPEQSKKRITRASAKSLKKSSNQEKNNTYTNTSVDNFLRTDSNNNENELSKSKETIYEDALTETPKEPDSITKDQTKILENGQQQFVGNETFAYPNNIPTNITFVQAVIPDVAGESTFVIKGKISNENENKENIVLLEPEKTFILPESQTQKVGILNPDFNTISKENKPDEKNTPVASSKSSNQITNVVQKPKNTGAIPKQPSKENKNSGVNKKTPACAVLLKKPNSSSKQYKNPLTTAKSHSAKAPSRVYNNSNERKNTGNSVANNKGKYQSPNLMQIQQEKEFLRRLEQKRNEIEAKDKQKLAKQIALEQQIKKSVQAIQEKKLQITKNNQIEELKKEYNFNMLNSDDSTDDENYKSTKRSEPPLWSKRHTRDMRIECQNFLPVKIIDSFFSVAPLNPDLRDIFPEIHPRDLKRNSSIIWKTPPRYSQLPKY